MHVDLRAVTRRVDGRRLLDAVTLSVEPGQTLLLCGPNGAGKSTLLKVMAGLLPPTGGEILYDGRPASRWGPALRRRLGVVLHETLLYDELTVVDNLVFAARLFGVPDARRRAEGMVDAAGLRLVAREPAGRLSRGMKQRLALVRALLHRPSVLLLDEPYAGLDARWSAWLTDLLAAERARGTSVILVAHEWRTAWPVADRAAVLLRGRLARLLDTAAWDPDRFGGEYGRLLHPERPQAAGPSGAAVGATAAVLSAGAPEGESGP
ncbi:MAG TPA: ABC transporter ATP-binding protein [Limnochordales bacterium]|nr:ABC transporter ATP-binding protein [Limnochordales bacterium]